MGDFYLSTLVFCHDVSQESCNTNCFHYSFTSVSRGPLKVLAAIRKRVNLLSSKRIVVVSDREFDFSDIFPWGTHVFCWNHLEQDLKHYLKGKANCNATDISFFVQSFKGLMSEETAEF